MFEGEIYVLPLYYNVYSLVFKFEYQELMKLRKPYRYTYDEELYNEARNNPAITHYTGLFCIKHRPWIKNSDHPHKQAFLNYYRLTPWNETPLMEARKNFFSNAVAFLCDYTPKVLMIKIANLVYYYIRPLAFKRRMKKNIGGIERTHDYIYWLVLLIISYTLIRKLLGKNIYLFLCFLAITLVLGLSSETIGLK